MHIASKTKSAADVVEPAYVSIDTAANYTSESPWVVKDLLRRGIYKAKKAGRRTIVEFSGVKERAANLPDAKFALPRQRRQHETEAA
jgi:hypothetical protein